jgi:hypothetical protein
MFELFVSKTVLAADKRRFRRLNQNHQIKSAFLCVNPRLKIVFITETFLRISLY